MCLADLFAAADGSGSGLFHKRFNESDNAAAVVRCFVPPIRSGVVLIFGRGHAVPPPLRGERHARTGTIHSSGNVTFLPGHVT